MSLNLQNLIIFSIILVEGFVTISVEILAIRQLIPFVGSNVTVTSLIIGVFLLFLAKGYQKGGQVKANYTKTLIQNFLWAGLIIGVGLSFPFLELYFSGIRKLFGDHLIVGLTLYLIGVLAPIVYLLGQTVPITMHLKNNGKSAGSIGGDVLHLSTIGSFLGAVLTSVICMRYLGVAQTIFLNYALLLFLIFALLLKDDNQHLKLFSGITLGVFIFYINVIFESAYFITTTNFANYRTVDTKEYYNTEGKILEINNSASSYINKEGRIFQYAEKIHEIFVDLSLENKDILVLGAGGFTIGKDEKKNQYTFLDIDSKLPKIAKENFIPSINGDIIIEDARKFLLANDKKYDVIIVDVFTHLTTIPPHVTTISFDKLVKNSLRPDGFAIYNKILNPWFNTDYAQKIDNTLNATYNHCLKYPLSFKNENVNILYLCKDIKNKSNQIYVDNYNDNEFDLYGAQ